MTVILMLVDSKHTWKMFSNGQCRGERKSRGNKWPTAFHGCHFTDDNSICISFYYIRHFTVYSFTSHSFRHFANLQRHHNDAILFWCHQPPQSPISIIVPQWFLITLAKDDDKETLFTIKQYLDFGQSLESPVIKVLRENIPATLNRKWRGVFVLIISLF